MGRLQSVVALALSFAALPCRGADPFDSAPHVTLGANEYLVAGADLIRAGQFDDGIRLTLLGLDQGGLAVRNRAAGLGNLCSAFVSKSEPDRALPYCDESLQLDGTNWRVYTARSQAYFVKGMFADAARDNDAAAAINPGCGAREDDPRQAQRSAFASASNHGRPSLRMRARREAARTRRDTRYPGIRPNAHRARRARCPSRLLRELGELIQDVERRTRRQRVDVELCELFAQERLLGRRRRSFR